MDDLMVTIPYMELKRLIDVSARVEAVKGYIAVQQYGSVTNDILGILGIQKKEKNDAGTD